MSDLNAGQQMDLMPLQDPRSRTLEEYSDDQDRVTDSSQKTRPSDLSTDPQSPFMRATPCFAVEEFSLTSFDADLFVAKCRGAATLSQLQSDLFAAREQLRHETVQLIHKDYGEFIALATSLVGLDRAVNALRAPLTHLRAQVQGVHLHIAHLKTRVEQQLLQRQQLIEVKQILQLCVAADLSARKVESLINPDSLEKDVMCERVAVELNRLAFLLSKNKSVPFMQTLVPKYEAFQALLHQILDELFVKAISEKNAKTLSTCLRAYAALDEISRVEEEICRKIIMRPVISKVITKTKIEKGTGGSSDGYADVLQELLSLLQKDFKFLLDCTLGSAAVVAGYDFLAHSFFADVVDTFIRVAPSIFATGIADSFHKNYTLTLAFFEKIEAYYSTSAEIRSFRNSAAYTELTKKFQIQTYFKLRFQEIAGNLETALNKEDLGQDEPNPEEFSLPFMKTLWACLTSCWNPNVCLPVLVPQFYRVTIQILSRLSLYLQEGLDVIEGKNKEARAWTFITSENYAVLYHDIGILEFRAQSFFEGHVKPFVELMPKDQQVLIEDSIKSHIVRACAIIPKTGSIITSPLEKRCSDNLKAAKGIPALYRMTNKPVPTKFSPYVHTILQPMDKFLQSKGGLLPADLRLSWIRAIVDTVTVGYLDVLSDALQTLKKTEDSLKKIQKRQTTTTSQGAVSDTEKICRQMILDVEEYGNLLAKFGIEKTSLDSYTRLFEYVQESNKMFAD
eukprot:TRINITY_DN3188_c0_g1_i2.p1 TRINITY_DN3188_c0_g1~~TRINITY_DN3188_c0_g1_i2.p1  ORF type:complete len:735 (+),score=160.93 TRINITY_DN3188_c0_g1_i2:44-2248(+)